MIYSPIINFRGHLHFGFVFIFTGFLVFGMSGRRCRRSMLVATISIIFSPHDHDFSVAPFSHRRSARIKKLIYRKLFVASKKMGLDPFPDLVGYFGAPWWPFLVLQAVRHCRQRANAPWRGTERLVYYIVDNYHRIPISNLHLQFFPPPTYNMLRVKRL